jgi:hypothetical protein
MLLPAVEVQRFLLGDDFPAPQTRLWGHLTTAACASINPSSTSTVNSWLVTASKCALGNLVQLCIDYITSQNLPVHMDLLTSLEPSHAGQLLEAMHRKLVDVNINLTTANGRLSTANSKIDRVIQHLGSRSPNAYTCINCGSEWLGKNKCVTCCGKRFTKSIPLFLYIERVHPASAL